MKYNRPVLELSDKELLHAEQEAQEYLRAIHSVQSARKASEDSFVAKRAECERLIDADRQRRWNAKTPVQQAEYLIMQLNRTMGLYGKMYTKLSRSGLDWLKQNDRLSRPAAIDLDEEIPF